MSKQVTITIDIGNAAFEGLEGYEVSRILRKLADDLIQVDDLSTLDKPLKLHDYNGQSVGDVKVTLC